MHDMQKLKRIVYALRTAIASPKSILNVVACAELIV